MLQNIFIYVRKGEIIEMRMSLTNNIHPTFPSLFLEANLTHNIGLATQ